RPASGLGDRRARGGLGPVPRPSPRAATRNVRGLRAMISVVVPVHNEGESLVTLHAELAQVAASGSPGEFEFLFVDDGSRDASWEVIGSLGRNAPRVRGIRFRRNFGKAAALTAGFQAARGEIVFTLDGDLQDDPAEIPRFLERLDQGLDVVSGWK